MAKYSAAAEPMAIGPAMMSRPSGPVWMPGASAGKPHCRPPVSAGGQSVACIKESCGAYSRRTELKSPPMRASRAARLLAKSIGQDAVGCGANSGSGLERSAW
jgi:hypothetical protein